MAGSFRDSSFAVVICGGARFAGSRLQQWQGRGRPARVPTGLRASGRTRRSSARSGNDQPRQVRSDGRLDHLQELQRCVRPEARHQRHDRIQYRLHANRSLERRRDRQRDRGAGQRLVAARQICRCEGAVPITADHRR